MVGRGPDATPTRARGRRRRRATPSLRRVIGSVRSAGRTPRLLECLARAGHDVAHDVHRFLGAIAVVATGILEVVLERRRLLAAADVVTAQDAIVVAGF